MATLSTTTLPELRALFTARIVSTTPRITYKGAERWKPYERATSSATTSRRFRILWGPGRYFEKGYFTPESVETNALLRVRVDYTGDHTHLLELAQDDWHQLRDRLHDLTADPANGLTLVQPTSSPPSQVADTDHARQRLGASPSGSDTIQIDLTFDIRYFKARASAA